MCSDPTSLPYQLPPAPPPPVCPPPKPPNPSPLPPPSPPPPPKPPPPPPPPPQPPPPPKNIPSRKPSNPEPPAHSRKNTTKSRKMIPPISCPTLMRCGCCCAAPQRVSGLSLTPASTAMICEISSTASVSAPSKSLLRSIGT